VETNPIGQERIGLQTDSFTFSLDIHQAEGVNSGRRTNVSVQGTSDDIITIVPMMITDVDIVSEWKNRVIDKTLFNF
jgi:hypothetical protein